MFGEHGFVESHGLLAEPEVWHVDEGPPGEIDVRAYACPVCGWWCVGKTVSLYSRSQIWDLTFRVDGALRTLDLADIRLPVSEVRRYLVAKYESRFGIHPRKFEGVVASVFRSLGFDAAVTGYSRDGGIDVVLDGKAGERIGIQVKRYRNRITVEQIRAFIGALVVGGFTRGIFVTTSDYQPGVLPLVRRAANKCAPIDLYNAGTFFAALKVAQVADAGLSADVSYIPELYPPPALHFTDEYHRNSL
jgi:restriction system protein